MTTSASSPTTASLATQHRGRTHHLALMFEVPFVLRKATPGRLFFFFQRRRTPWRAGVHTNGLSTKLFLQRQNTRRQFGLKGVAVVGAMKYHTCREVERHGTALQSLHRESPKAEIFIDRGAVEYGFICALSTYCQIPRSAEDLLGCLNMDRRRRHLVVSTISTAIAARPQ